MTEILKTQGIDSKGYGRIYKLAMRDQRLHILSKAIYAYFCAYAGNGTTAFPKRNKILIDLQLNKDTYSKYLKELVEAGYIIRQRTSRGNLYTINMQVPAIDAPSSIVDSKGDVLRLSNVKSKGFGTVPKLLMLDRNLTAQAKAIYAYFASYAGAGTVAFPHKSTIMKDLDISQRTYYAHFGQLTETGYVSVKQRKVKGKFSVSEYILNEEISVDSPISEKLHPGQASDDSVENLFDYVENSENSSMSQNLQSDRLMSEEPLSEESAHQIIGHANIINIPTSNSIYDNEQDQNQQAQERMKNSSVNLTAKQIMERIDYQGLLKEADAAAQIKNMLGHFPTNNSRDYYIKRYREIVRQVIKQSLRILTTKGEQTQELKGNLLLRLNRQDISDLCNSLAEQYLSIKNMEAYVRSSLINFANLNTG